MTTQESNTTVTDWLAIRVKRSLRTLAGEPLPRSQSVAIAIRVAVGISLAALCNVTQASAGSDSGGLEVHGITHPPTIETDTQEEAPRCDPSYPTLAAGYFAVLQSEYGPKPKEEGRAGGAVAKRLPPCQGLPVSRSIAPAIGFTRFTRRTRTRYSYPLGNEMGIRRWAFDSCGACQGAGRVPRRWVPLWSVETTEAESYGFPVPR